MFDYINPAILPLGFFFFFCSVIGVIGNTIMVFCTIRTKRFRSPCHLLICATCVADLLHVCGQFPFCVHLFGNRKLKFSFRVHVLVYSHILSSSMFLYPHYPDCWLHHGRLIAVKFPTKYRYYQEEPRNYVIAQLAFPVLYSIAFLVYGFLVRDTDAKNQMVCSNPLSLNGYSFQMFTYTSGIIYIAVFFIYLSVYVMLKSNKASARFKNVFRSILVTVGFVLLGWVTTTTANTLSYSITDDLLTIQLIQMYAGITVNFAAASNVFVFYAINSEYRAVIQSMFGIRKKGGMIFEPSSTQTVTKVVPRSVSQPSVMFQQSPAAAARRMTVV
ncbi:CRE-SRSX-27 protein [Caenorhabditis remanei]|uniref:CRE-SRSX-27 protein n=1 Tax=Caenorhabditis remanei TaxID=31234 RepID=E3LTV0_CAERE|nr:CRE-SRSX-27 protein [Caenorhabditis remanei]